MKNIKIVMFKTLLNLFFASIFFTTMAQTIQPVPYVDLNKYVGKWYEIASFPQRFQKRCNCTTAEYTMTNKGYVIVENRCNKDSINGKQSYIKGKAFIQEHSGNAKLIVQFFWPFKGDYWIIDLAEDYSYAVVGNPNKKYLWILCRTPIMNETIYQKIISKLIISGFDVSKINKTKQI
jgi:apolipoprotein D and lipocalin family protein